MEGRHKNFENKMVDCITSQNSKMVLAEHQLKGIGDVNQRLDNITSEMAQIKQDVHRDNIMHSELKELKGLTTQIKSLEQRVMTPVGNVALASRGQQSHRQTCMSLSLELHSTPSR